MCEAVRKLFSKATTSSPISYGLYDHHDKFSTPQGGGEVRLFMHLHDEDVIQYLLQVQVRNWGGLYICFAQEIMCPRNMNTCYIYIYLIMHE